MLRAVILFFLFIFIFNSSAFAARNIIISSDKASLSGEEELFISASPSGFTNGEKIFIKGAFFKEGSSNYFGYTKDGNEWIGNSITATSQRGVDMSSWDNSVVVRADFDDGGFVGVGDYKFKLGFYYKNSNGNLSSVNWSENNISISITAIPTEIPIVESNSEENNEDDEEEIVVREAFSSPTKIPTIFKKTSTITPESDKISTSLKTASEYAKIEPITNREEKEDEDSEVLGLQDSMYPRVLVVSGGLFLIIAGFMLARSELIKRRGF